MKIAAALVLLLGTFFLIGASARTSDAQVQTAFQEWMHTHGKSYHHYEFQFRWQIWRDNFFWIEEFNSKGNASHTVAMNQFGDLTADEFGKIYKGFVYEHDPSTKVPLLPTTHELFGVDIPDNFDWRTKGAVTHVKNQGQCGSCYSFSATGATEGAYFLANNKLVSLSEQNIVDCSHSFGNNGCNGGLMDNAFKYIIQNHGIDTEGSYPYTARVGQCKFSSHNVGAQLTSYADVPSGDEKALLAAASKQPVSVGIDASHSSFQFYSTGVYHEPQCSSRRLDHGVLVVGWGNLNGDDYWIVKNSWGETWGQKGYILMARNKNNNCGIATAASYPVAGKRAVTEPMHDQFLPQEPNTVS